MTRKKGDIVEIFVDWRTKGHSEGMAKLIKLHWTQDDHEYWSVCFESDGFKADRFILKEGENT